MRQGTQHAEVGFEIIAANMKNRRDTMSRPFSFQPPYIAVAGFLIACTMLPALAPHRHFESPTRSSEAATVLQEASRLCSEGFLNCSAFTPPVFHASYYHDFPKMPPYDVWETNGLTPNDTVQMLFEASNHQLVYLNRENYQEIWNTRLPITIATPEHAIQGSEDMLLSLHLLAPGVKLKLGRKPNLTCAHKAWDVYWMVQEKGQAYYIDTVLSRRGGELLRLIKRRPQR